ncbi:MAG: hypothetical protein ACLPX9_10545 [Rhodomicrobium sp.]
MVRRYYGIAILPAGGDKAGDKSLPSWQARTSSGIGDAHFDPGQPSPTAMRKV